MATTNFTEAQAAFGFAGYFDLGTDTSRRSFQGARSTWTGYITGTDASLSCDGGGSNPFYVSVDGGTPTAPSVSASAIVLFAGLSDTAHLVQITNDPAYSPTFNWTFTSGTFLSVTGGAPAIGYGADLGPSLLVALSSSPCIDARSYSSFASIFSGPITPVTRIPDPAITNYAAGGETLIRAKCTDLWVFTGAIEAWYAIDTGLPIQVTLPTLPGFGWKKIVTGLDGSTIHDYHVIACEDPSLTGTIGVMVGGTGATLYTPTPRKRAAWFGDSIVQTRVVTDANSGSMDAYKAAGPNGAVAQGLGYAGQTASGLATDIPAILATITLPDVAVLCIGKNDSSGAPFQASYTSCINALLAGGIPFIICRGVAPLQVGEAAKNTNIAAAVTALGNPNVVYVDSAAWTGIDTADGIHPTKAGYVTLGAYEATDFASYLVPPPYITVQPINVTAKLGSTATLSLTGFASNGTLTYQWQKQQGGSFSNVSGATSNSYTTATLGASDSAAYRCNITDSNGTVVSAVASLTVARSTKSLRFPATWPTGYDRRAKPLGRDVQGDFLETFFQSEFFDAATGQFKSWNGSAWATKPIKVWNGSAWVVKPVKRWNGSAWVTLT